MLTYVVGTQKDHLIETVLLSTLFVLFISQKGLPKNHLIEMVKLMLKLMDKKIFTIFHSTIRFPGQVTI